MDEQALTGGNASDAVVRFGDTVRKPWTPATPIVTTYVEALRAAGIDAPKPMGRDDRGRSVQEFVIGPSAMDVDPLSHADLRRVGSMVRRIHDASVGFVPPADAVWETAIPAPGADLVCHNDLAPWNLIVGDRWVFIDWDASAPSTRLWDLAYAAQAFTLNDATTPPEVAAARLTAFVDGYGADPELREALPQGMTARTAAMVDLLESSHRDGREPWASMYLSGHGAHWSAALRYVETHSARWAAALAAPAPPDATADPPTRSATDA